METGVNQKVSTTTAPLSSISPRRINSSNISSASASQKEQDQQLEDEISRQENQITQKLRARDREVRAHEAAHMAAARAYVTSGPNFTYQRGPDGRSYAIGGEVTLDTSEVADDLEATLSKAETVRRAALAPAKPSSQDLRVAADASQMAAQTRLEIAIERREQGLMSASREQDESMSRDRNNQAIESFTTQETPSAGFSQFA